MERLLLVKYGEIFLKGQNRPFFFRSLRENLSKRVQGVGAQVAMMDGRLYVTAYPVEKEKQLIQIAADTFGVVGVCPAIGVEKNMKTIAEAAVSILQDAIRENANGTTFKIQSRRQDKQFPLDSFEISAQIGGVCLERIPNIRVDVHHPRHIIQVEIRDKAYLYCYEAKGIGGLPVGVSGRAAVMLSGGIDSPVAAYMMAKRGLEIQAIHFMSPPHTGEAAKEKVRSLAQRIAYYLGPVKLHLVHFTQIQEKLYDVCQDDYLTILMRRYMCRIAEWIACKEDCGALITGESLGQVASQTLAAIHATNSNVTLPIFRPLIGMDKYEIVDIANCIGTFSISTLPGEDCCTVFVPRHPVLRPSIQHIITEEEKLDGESLIKYAIDHTQVEVFRP